MIHHKKKTDRLVVLDRYRACMISIRQHQNECHPNAKCSHHPKERHFWHLCDGPGVTHPGKQNIPNAQAWLAQGVEDEEEEATPIETDANSAEVTEILRCHLNCT